MSNVPVVCDNCGLFFTARNLIDAPGSTVTFQDVGYGPCPRCGAMGRIPDGTYAFVGDITHLLQAPQRTQRELQILTGIFENAQKRQANQDDIKREVEQAVPQLAAITDLLPRTRNRAELYAFIALVIAILQLLLSTPGNLQSVNVDPDVVVNIATGQQAQPSETQARQPTDISPRKVVKVGRNEPCPCGSGKKYKKCHGDPTRGQDN